MKRRNCRTLDTQPRCGIIHGIVKVNCFALRLVRKREKCQMIFENKEIGSHVCNASLFSGKFKWSQRSFKFVKLSNLRTGSGSSRDDIILKLIVVLIWSLPSSLNIHGSAGIYSACGQPFSQASNNLIFNKHVNCYRFFYRNAVNKRLEIPDLNNKNGWYLLGDSKSAVCFVILTFTKWDQNSNKSMKNENDLHFIYVIKFKLNSITKRVLNIF